MPAHNESTLWRTQNFLRDRTLVLRLVSRAKIAPTDVVYDLGAGGGILTDALARRAGRVIALEKDPALVTRLKARFHDRPNVEIRHADILAHPLPRAEYVVFASPPFDATSAIVRKLTSAAAPLSGAVLISKISSPSALPIELASSVATAPTNWGCSTPMSGRR